MRVLIYSRTFAPQVGGLETVTMSLASGLAQAFSAEPDSKPKVTVVTQVPAQGFKDSSLPFQVVRQPGLVQLAHLFKAADVIHVAGPSFLPLILSLVLR